MKLQSPKATDILPEPVPVPTIDLARLLAKPPADGLIELPSGVFRIRCDGMANHSTANGLTIRGKGYQRTFIQRDPNPADAVNNQPVLRLDGDDCVAENFTWDAGGSVGDEYAHMGLHMFGRNARVRNVRGIRPSGLWPASPPAPPDAWKVECFSFFICGEGSIVSGCRLEQVPFDPDHPGNYVEGFSVNGDTLYCHVEFPVLTGNVHPPFFNGFQFSGVNGGSFIGCTQNGGNGFVYTDTGSNRNVYFGGCRASRVQQGFDIVVKAGDSIDGLFIQNNIIELALTAPPGAQGIVVEGAGDKRNIIMERNMVRYVGGQRGPAANINRICAVGVFGGSTGTIIRDNVMDADFTAVARESDGSDTPGAVVANNSTTARIPTDPT